MSRLVRFRPVGIQTCVLMLLIFCSSSFAVDVLSQEMSQNGYEPTSFTTGTLSFEFDEDQLWAMGIELSVVGGFDVTQHDEIIAFRFDMIEPHPTIDRQDKSVLSSIHLMTASGAIVLERAGKREIVSAITLTYGNDGSVRIQSAAHIDEENATFRLTEVTWFSNQLGDQQLYGDIVLTQAAASRLGYPTSADLIVGHLSVFNMDRDVKVARSNLAIDAPTMTTGGPNLGTNQSLAPSPDVIVGDLHQLNSYGVLNNLSAFSVGTVSCNIGTAPLKWLFNTNEHPVIAQNLYRHKGGRFEQIGMSWLKHGFFALSDDLCFPGQCDGDPSGESLGPKCSDPYSASLNGQQGNLGPRSEVNAFTGEYPFPFGGAQLESLLSRRLQVNNDDLSPTLNTGAAYFVEGQYVTPDDAAASNGRNNASYRKIDVTEAGGTFVLSFPGEDTVRTFPAIYAWQAIEPEVQLSTVLVPGEGSYTLGARVTNLGNETWHYEYALHNLNSHRSVQSFSVPLFPGVALSNIGFHDVDYHSGEPYDQTPWQAVITNDAITWSTDDFAINPDANALRWGTMYNFRFDANAPAEQLAITIGMFRPGTPGSVTVTAPAPTDNIIAPGIPSQPYDVTKDRYVTIDPNTNGNRLIAFRVTRMDGTESAYVSCTLEDLGAQGVFGSLVASPEFCSWNTQVLHIGGCMIAPGNTYSIEGTLDAVNFSSPLLVSTTNVPSPREFGDVVGVFANNVWSGPDGLVSSVDILAAVQGFQLVDSAPLIARLDLVPKNPNHVLAADDILAVVLAFSGDAYQYGLSCSTGTCVPDCTNP